MSNVIINGPAPLAPEILGGDIESGTFFMGSIGAYAGLFLKAGGLVVLLSPRPKHPAGYLTWDYAAPVRCFQPVDVEITYTPCK